MRSVIAVCAATFLWSCDAPLRVQARFQPAGLHGAASLRSPSVATADDIRLYIRTAPEGFTLANNELEVKDGHAHQILGDVRVKYGSGVCPVGNANRADLIAAIQDAAWRAGGNAVIYVNLAWDDSTERWQRCDTRADPDPTFATGWVVILEQQ